MTASTVAMKTTFTLSDPRCPRGGGRGVPKTQLKATSPKTEKTHGHHGRGRPAGTACSGRRSTARSQSGNVTSEARKKGTAQAEVCTGGPPGKKVQGAANASA